MLSIIALFKQIKNFGILDIMKLISWNINGLRAVHRKDALKEIWKLSPDIFCVQETKITEDEIPFDLKHVLDYHSFFDSAEKRGYSGVGMYSKKEPLHVENSFGDSRFDNEGRIIKAKFDKFTLFNIYFPNGKASKERLKYKMDFYYSFLEALKEMKNEKIIICGDINTAHKEIDLARPKQNEKVSGFLPEERKWIDELLSLGYLDTLREFNTEENLYTWWDLKSRARSRNVGWRIDYFFVSKNLKNNLKNAYILSEIMGSDHAPVVLEMSF
jgi:exodeoxyribonuclease III